MSSETPHTPAHPPNVKEATQELTDGNKNRNLGPFANELEFMVSNWYWNGSTQKTQKDTKALLEFLSKHGFSSEQIAATNWRKIDTILGKSKAELKEGEGDWIDDDGWKTTPVDLKIPFHRLMSQPGVHTFKAGTLYHRSIVEIVKEKLANTADYKLFHSEPYNLYWEPSNVYADLYNSDAFVKAHQEIQDPANNPDCSLPRAVIGLMFWSDQTLLTNFGKQKVWPLYMGFANESKYRRGQSSSNLCHQVAYFETLPDSVRDFISQRTGGSVQDEFMAFLNRETFHRQWSILLDDELLDAIENGLVITCCDGKKRRFYIRIFTYSADFPEKILISSIRRGTCPCPRCMMEQKSFHRMGTPEDQAFRDKNPRLYDKDTRAAVVQARKDIFEKNLAATGAVVKRGLKSRHLTPTRNAFAFGLRKTSFSLTSILVVDLLHEFEIGVWKDLYIHLIRILDLSPSSILVNDLDRRFRNVPSFGQAIRKFASNMSNMSRRAARDYEDVLQCSIVVFENFFEDPHGEIIAKLLYLCCQWHAFAKLRLHTDRTLELFEATTVALGNQFRLFMNVTCANITTYELPREVEARQRRASKSKSAPQSASQPVSTQRSIPDPPPIEGRRVKKLNISTYKFHSLGDYPQSIKKYGPVDAYSSELGEMLHKLPKDWFSRTNRRNVRRQITRIERRKGRLKTLARKHSDQLSHQDLPSPEKQAPSADPEIPFLKGTSTNEFISLSLFADNGVYSQDPLCDNFIFNLKSHLYARLPDAISAFIDWCKSFAPGASAVVPDDWSNINVRDKRLYTQKTLRIKYDSYDLRSGEDLIHVGTDNCNVMVLNPNYKPGGNGHPFLYARVLQIFNAQFDTTEVVKDAPNRFYTKNPWLSVPCLWIHWYEWSPRRSEFQLDPVRLKAPGSPGSTAFIHPKDILRASHIIPRFTLGWRKGCNGSNSATAVSDRKDWVSYYVNRFADRDMFMRYLWGFAIGHKYARAASTTIASALSVVPTVPDVEMADNLILVAEDDNADDVEMAGDLDNVGDDMDVDDEESNRYGV
ncbi:hypothetical protein FA15DRAFT_603337 [Coprinopsis marcescibilis]|uniref:Uncharacterized protein n=1 Tax=Coprinopsis marcescibilis TaxID=230819 RepID=A0A5C3KFE4_COPMA|nr:hypothetical protein FA15DRAFT_603337 [Coprinopsis marcescibilis]